MITNNPYIVGGTPTPKVSFCVFADILGFKEMMVEAYKIGKELDLFERLYLTVSDGINQLKQDDKEAKDIGKRLWVHKTFSDNIILGCPINFHDFGEPEWWMTISQLAEYQLAMVLKGFFLRGGLVLGELFIDDEMIYGSALIESVLIEEKEAINPRIVISSGVMDLVRKQIGFYTNRSASPHNSEIMLDSDNKHFIDYLDVFAGINGKIDGRILEKHKTVILHCLKKFNEDSAIYPKYLWAAEYHNYYCKSNDLVEYLIEIDQPRNKFRKLIE